MIKIKIKFGAGTGKEHGLKEMEIIASSDLKSTMQIIEKRTGFPLQERLTGQFVILVNGKNYFHYLNNKIPLKDGDTLLLVPILGGG